MHELMKAGEVQRNVGDAIGCNTPLIEWDEPAVAPPNEDDEEEDDKI